MLDRYDIGLSDRIIHYCDDQMLECNDIIEKNGFTIKSLCKAFSNGMIRGTLDTLVIFGGIALAVITYSRITKTKIRLIK